MKDFFTEQDCDENLNWKKEIISDRRYISLDKANRILREWGKVVYGRKDCRYWDDHPPGLDDDSAGKVITQGPKNVQAILINIEPIAEPDSAEKVLEDLAKEARLFTQHHNPEDALRNLAERARRLLNKGRK